MEYQDYIDLGLNGEAPLKLILCGAVEDIENGKLGVVSVVYATQDRELAKKKISELSKSNPDAYYMVYSVPLDTDLSKIGHYPSIAISKEDLE